MDKKKLIKTTVNTLGRILMILSLVFVVRAVYRLGFDFSVISNVPSFVALCILGALIFALGVFIQGMAWKSWLDFFIDMKRKAADGEETAGRTADRTDGSGVGSEVRSDGSGEGSEVRSDGSGAGSEVRTDGSGGEPAEQTVGRVDTREALCVYARANIGKYLPGNVMHYVERNLFAAKSGAPQSSVALSSIFEIGTQVAVALLLAFLCKGGTVGLLLDEIVPGWRNLIFVALAAGAVLFIIALTIAIKVFGSRLKKLFSGFRPSVFLLTLIKTMLLYVSVMLIGGLLMAVMFAYMGMPVTPHLLLQIVPGYVIAWVLGFVVPGAPGGIGVREFVLTVLLGFAAGGRFIVTVMVIHRLVNILGDFAAYLIQMALSRKAKAEEGGVSGGTDQ